MPDRVDVPSQPGYDQTFRSRDGLVGRDLYRRAGLVQDAARRQAGVRTARLRSSIDRQWMNTSGDSMAIRVGSDVGYALVHHEGSRPHVIRARNVSVLRFVKDGQVVFAKSVHHPGTRSNHYLTDSLDLAVR